MGSLQAVLFAKANHVPFYDVATYLLHNSCCIGMKEAQNEACFHDAYLLVLEAWLRSNLYRIQVNLGKW